MMGSMSSRIQAHSLPLSGRVGVGGRVPQCSQSSRHPLPASPVQGEELNRARQESGLTVTSEVSA